MQCWLAIESFSNWKADSENNFEYLGVTDYFANTATQARNGDVIFIYVPSPERSFADVREVTADGLAKSGHLRKYSVVCYAGLRTRSLISILPTYWLPFKAVSDHLSFTRSSYGMRKSFRRLRKPDAFALAAHYETKSPNVDFSALRVKLADLSAKADNAKRSRIATEHS